MIVGVPREGFPGERRVALVPAALANLSKIGLEVIVESGAGVEAGYPDADYAAKGAKIISDRAEVFRTADIIVQVLCPGANDKTGNADLAQFRRDQIVIGFFRPMNSVDVLKTIAEAPKDAPSVEITDAMMPGVVMGTRNTEIPFLPGLVRASKKQVSASP